MLYYLSPDYSHHSHPYTPHTMATFREDVLTEVTALCQQLYNRRRSVVETQAHVSDRAKADVVLLILRLNQLAHTDPFPERATADVSPLEGLKAKIADSAEDPVAIQASLLEWVGNFAPTVVTASPAPSKTVPPLNQRMLDLLFDFRQGIDQTRRRLMRDRDRYDLEAYRQARNAFTLARAVYDERLRLGQVEATNNQCATVENELTPDMRQATGANFPASIRAAADFISDNIFAEDNV